MIRSGNPVLKGKVFNETVTESAGKTMSVQGTVNRTFLLLLVTIFTASWVWGEPAKFLPFIWGAVIGGLIIALVTVFKKEWAPVTSPLYAFVEGIVLGTISAIFERQYPGIVIQAVALTFGTLFCLLMAYKSRLIKATENFKLGVTAATGGIFMIYLFSMILGFFNINIPFIHESGIIGIGFSLFVVVIAALNLVMDFDFIENGEKNNAPQYMEWYGAFSLVVTLIWLYLEILRLLAKTRQR